MLYHKRDEVVHFFFQQPANICIHIAKFYYFNEINRAIYDVRRGDTIKPCRRFSTICPSVIPAIMFFMIRFLLSVNLS